MSDRRLLYASAFLRSLATGMTGVLLGIYLARVGLTPVSVGVVIAAGLAGATASALAVTLAGDRIGRRACLAALGALGCGGALAAAFSASPVLLGAAAFLGMLNGMGRDRGAALVLEQAMLSTAGSDKERTQSFAWYNVVQDVGHAVGSLAAGLPELLRHAASMGEVGSLRIALGVIAALALIGAPIALRISPVAESDVVGPRPPVSPGTKRTLWQISSLFSLDGLGSGFLTTSLVALFFSQRFGAGEGAVGALFFGARVANAASHLGAAWLARRIGLVRTMVFTHIPSSLLLVTVAFAPSFPVAAILFLLREGLVEMDVPTRQSYVMAVVRPEERTVASGVTHLVRLGAWAVAPSFAGALMQGASLGAPLVVGASLKITYDVLLYVAFRHRHPPEETAV